MSFLFVFIQFCLRTQWMRPFAPGHDWKRAVRCAIFVLALSCVCVNALSAYSSIPVGGVDDADPRYVVAVTAAGYVVAVQVRILCCFDLANP